MNLFKNKVFSIILVTDIIQQMAIWIRNFSIMFFCMEITNNNPIAISGINFLSFLPMFLLTFVGGIIADKFNPKKIMLLGDSLSFISFIILGLLLNVGVVASIFIGMFLSAIITQFSYPASTKYIKEYVEEEKLEKAIGISQLIGSVFYIVGPFIGSTFYFTFGINKTFFIIAVLFIISVIMISFLPNKEFKKTEEESWKDEIIKTKDYIKQKKEMKALLKIFLLLSLSLGVGTNLDIFLVTEKLGLSTETYQYFSGIAGIGVLVGGGIYIALSKFMQDFRYLRILFIGLGIALLGEGLSTIPFLTFIFQFLDNLIGGILGGYILTLLTKMTSQEYLGRVNGTFQTLMYLGIMIGTLGSGILMKNILIEFAYVTGVIALLGCSIYCKVEKEEKIGRE
ncbi:MAG: MFS transporter [Clostridium sp.]